MTKQSEKMMRLGQSETGRKTLHLIGIERQAVRQMENENGRQIESELVKKLHSG